MEMRMNRRQLLCALPALPAAAAALASASPLAPEFTSADPRDWINSTPLHWSDLANRVVLLDVWTFECWNCYRSFPWLRSVEERFAARGLSVIGIHSPELPAERERTNVRAAVVKFELHHPVMIDNDFRYWKALDNQYWPAFYLVDRHRRIRGTYVGETHAGDPQALRIEAAIEELLR
jgi:thiol-disulfide isomerase/thioredoxin